jgi:AcrR family transcriptional regulator
MCLSYNGHPKVTKRENAMARDREETKMRIVAAVGKQLAKAGFRDLGVNSIAKEAGVDKVLIYRYFGGLPELLTAYANEGDYWPTSAELIGDPSTVKADSTADWLVYILSQVQMAIRKRPITLEILRWEIVDHNELTNQFAEIRTKVAIECVTFINQRCPFPPEVDVLALSTLILSGVTYINLRTSTNPSYLGMDFSTPEAWDRIDKLITSIIYQFTNCPLPTAHCPLPTAHCPLPKYEIEYVEKKGDLYGSQ